MREAIPAYYHGETLDRTITIANQTGCDDDTPPTCTSNVETIYETPKDGAQTVITTHPSCLGDPKAEEILKLQTRFRPDYALHMTDMAQVDAVAESVKSNAVGICGDVGVYMLHTTQRLPAITFEGRGIVENA